MKKRILTVITLICILSSALFTGCGQTASPSVTPYIPGSEPSQTEEAQKLYQFALPKDGETVAEFIVEDYGSIFVKFFPEEAPLAVENFLTHAKDGYYDGVKFHRVMQDFMIQGGDPKGTGYGGESIYGEPFADEFSSKLEPYRGALCMANSGANTNGSQFFLVQANTAFMDSLKELVEYKGYTLKQYLKSAYDVDLSEETISNYMTYGGTPWLSGHHTVFGQIFKGYEVLDAIAATETNSKDAPLNDVIIKTIRVYTYGGGDGV